MKPYGMNINNSPKLHSHDKCHVCRSYPPTRGSARLSNKKRVEEELDLSFGFDWDKDGDTILDTFFEAGFYGEEDLDYIKYG